ncbi:MAG: hypothetical protein L0H96_02405 [Humibacillus sp.]|nr:hypothetical protein [Humibacillus sp.]
MVTTDDADRAVLGDVLVGAADGALPVGAVHPPTNPTTAAAVTQTACLRMLVIIPFRERVT